MKLYVASMGKGVQQSPLLIIMVCEQSLRESSSDTKSENGSEIYEDNLASQL